MLVTLFNGSILQKPDKVPRSTFNLLCVGNSDDRSWLFRRESRPTTYTQANIGGAPCITSAIRTDSCATVEGLANPNGMNAGGKLHFDGGRQRRDLRAVAQLTIVVVAKCPLNTICRTPRDPAVAFEYVGMAVRCLDLNDRSEISNRPGTTPSSTCAGTVVTPSVYLCNLCRG